ncbi:MAG: redoxin domain-containing protein [Planctomyces sp.]|nr:redoxin domain-containing protein [Planctomyces sp.]
MCLKQMTLIALIVVSFCSQSSAQQRMQEREEEFLSQKPLIGDALPEVTVFNSDGSSFRTGDLKGHYTVLTFGCMTCPPSMWNIAGLEAVHRDYAPLGVKFFFIYKSLAHPELAGGYVQPFTTEERLMHANQAQSQFGTRIPWIVDHIDNRLKHALGDRPNSQFLIGPDGIVVRKRAWSNPQLVRKDLIELVGPTEKITQEDELNLKIQPPLPGGAVRGVVPRVKRPQMFAIHIDPRIDPQGQPFYAKLRAEADPSLLRDKSGMLYLGFHLDPFHNAHWNNLTEPLTVTIEAAESVQLEKRMISAEKVSVASDADPREFLLNVESWPENERVKLIVTYYACVGEETCHTVRQEYTLHLERDQDGGGAKGEGAGYWKPEEFTRQLMVGDKDKDGKLKKSEVVGLVSPHFEKLDTDQDGFLTPKELLPVADWLNHHHQPGTPSNTSDTTKK